MPRIGGRKLHYMLTETLQKHSISIGRDKLFDLLEEYGLLVRRRKRRKAITTDSNHPFHKYPNMVRELEVLRANHLWVSDITYISLREKFCYLSLVTDAYSRKIVGYCLHPTLKRDGPLRALSMALAGLPGKLQASLIHHSDRGLQYCCNDYISMLEAKGLSISMTEKGDPYENAIAERVNGILKQEFGLDQTFGNYEQALIATVSAVSIYNQQRPHASCNYLTPEEAHQQQGLLKTKWKRRAAMA
jgi:putative transposase